MTPEQIRKEAEELYPHFIVIDGVVQLHPTREENIDGYIAAATKYAGEIKAKDKEIERLRTMLRDAHLTGYIDGNREPMDSDESWEKFKTQNNI